MDPALYKDVTTSRDLKYHYYYSSAFSHRPTILFCHGFPSTSTEWYKMVPYFKGRGYGVLVPDMLGYGGTDKPTNPEVYTSRELVQDVVDILDAEKIDHAIAVGHDWGSRLVSRLSNFAPERFTAYAFLNLGYMDLVPDIPFAEYLERTKKYTGQELFGYWYFFDEDDVDETIQEHIESFADLIYPADPSVWIDRVAKIGGLKQSLLEGFRCDSAPYITPEERKEWVETFRKGGFTAPTCWYKVMTRGIAPRKDKEIPLDRLYPPVSSPIFFAGGSKDHICKPEMSEEVLRSHGFKDHTVTIKTYDVDHWSPLCAAEELNKDLDAWIVSFTRTE